MKVYCWLSCRIMDFSRSWSEVVNSYKPEGHFHNSGDGDISRVRLGPCSRDSNLEKLGLALGFLHSRNLLSIVRSPLVWTILRVLKLDLDPSSKLSSLSKEVADFVGYCKNSSDSSVIAGVDLYSCSSLKVRSEFNSSINFKPSVYCIKLFSSSRSALSSRSASNSKSLICFRCLERGHKKMGVP